MQTDSYHLPPFPFRFSTAYVVGQEHGLVSHRVCLAQSLGELVQQRQVEHELLALAVNPDQRRLLQGERPLELEGTRER